MKKTVITVIGHDCVGIMAKVSAVCAEYQVNICDVSQSVLSDLFCMIMIGEIDGMKGDFCDFSEKLEKVGQQDNLSIRAIHEDIFNAMHSI